MSIRDALTLKDYSATLPDGTAFTLRRPSALDLVEAVEFSKTSPERMYAWLVLRHLIEDGAPVFDSVDSVLRADGLVVAEIASVAESLYSEGRS